MNQYNFQVNLEGILSLLSQHIYSGPQVYLRELLQNGVDAMQARMRLEPGYKGRTTFEVVPAGDGNPPGLIVEDNGIGMTQEEVHQFLATIGSSSKRVLEGEAITDFIGQFGIGMLSAFTVSAEVVVITRKAGSSEPATEWRGRTDGTYTLRTLEGEFSPGTRVYLSAKRDMEDYFEPEKVLNLLRKYGSLLPWEVTFASEGSAKFITGSTVPWLDTPQDVAAVLKSGQLMFSQAFPLAIPLRARSGGVFGVAFVLPYETRPGGQAPHRVYIRRMLVSENAQGLLPEWAFFLQAVVNADDLKPTASRESLYENETLRKCREELGHNIRTWLIETAKREPRQMEALLGIHAVALKGLAVQDEEFFKLFIDLFPFETNMGSMSMGEIRQRFPLIRYTTSTDEFRQVGRILAARNIMLVNAAYIYEHELIARLPVHFSGTDVERLRSQDLGDELEPVPADVTKGAHEFLKRAKEVLSRFRCEPELKQFTPDEVPALYVRDENMQFLRQAEQGRETANAVWASVLDSFTQSYQEAAHASLILNYRNPLVRKLISAPAGPLFTNCIELLYVQALLLGHQPLTSREMGVLNSGLLNLIESSLKD